MCIYKGRGQSETTMPAAGLEPATGIGKTRARVVNLYIHEKHGLNTHDQPSRRMAQVQASLIMRIGRDLRGLCIC